MPELAQPDRKTLLSDAKLRADLFRFVRGRVPEAEAEDIVQATLTDALAAREVPAEPEDLRRWVFGIAKNKVVDHHRRGMREVTRDGAVGDEASAESAPLSARDLLRWAEQELPDAEGAQSTLEWMLREGAGEKLEHIAEEASLPPARVRQRVSRLRRYYRARWTAQLAAAAALLVLLLAVWAIWRGRATPGPDDIAQEVPTPEQRAAELRRAALERCAARDWRACLDGLDRAQLLDPKGDEAPAVRDARAAAGRALTPDKSAPPAPPTNRNEPAPGPSALSPKAPPAPTSLPPTKEAPPPDTKNMAPTKEPPPPDTKKMAPPKAPQSSELFEPQSSEPQQAPKKKATKAPKQESDFAAPAK